MKFAPATPIVCVSYNSPTENNAEGICTARLLSALALAGFRVHWVTGQHSRSLEEAAERELVHPGIEITRISTPRCTRLLQVLLETRHQLHAPYLPWVVGAVPATSTLLRQNPAAILLTRSMPAISNVVGYYCRRVAKAWVAHFSDPYPVSGWRHSRRGAHLSFALHRRWARRIWARADLLTVTCANAGRYMEEQLGVPLREKTHVLTHLALPKLAPGGGRFKRNPGEFWLAHFGNLMSQRNADVVLEGFLRAARKLPQLRFLQLGNVDPEVMHSEKLRGENLAALKLVHDGNLNPRAASDLREQVDVNVVVDADLGNNYSPFIASKYPHSVCSGRPLLMLSHEDSAMGDYTRRFGGGVLASFRDPLAVEAAVLRLHRAWLNADNTFVPSERLMREFAPETVIPPFLERVEEVLTRRAREAKAA